MFAPLESERLRSIGLSTPLLVGTVLFAFTFLPDVVNNGLLAAFLVLFFDKVKFRRKDVIFSCILLAVLLLSYLFTSNANLVRFIIYVPRFVILFAVLKVMSKGLSLIQLTYILRTIFLIHVSIILFCYLVPPFNAIIDALPWKYGQSNFRISGLFSGYDFISFFTVVFVFTEFASNNNRFNVWSLIFLALGFGATAVTGRFGLTLYAVYFLHLFFKDFKLSRIVVLLLGGVGLFALFSERILLLYNTFRLVKDSLALDDPGNSTLRLEDYGSKGEYDMYELSPLTLYHEITLPFRNLADHILPNTQNIVVDPGPSFVILNLGIILFVFVYWYNFQILFSSSTRVFMLILFVVLMDLKFRSALVLLPNVWLFFNLERIRMARENTAVKLEMH